MKKVLITGGHLTPALALIDELEKEKVEIYFVGRKRHLEGSTKESPEFTLLKSKVNFLATTTGRLQRRFTLHTIPSLLKIPVGFIQNLFLIARVRPNVVVTFGSYVSTPTVVAAWLFRIPIIVHEQASKVGLANRINAKLAEDIYSTWPMVVSGAEVVGNLTRKSIFEKSTKNKTIDKLLNSGRKLIYITGGSIGSHAINKVIFELLPKLGNYSIVHQLGTADYQSDHERAQGLKSENYVPIAYLESADVGAVLNRADIVISRSGANTVWELALLSKISILVPLPIAGANEQSSNAHILEKAGSAIVVTQENLTSESLLDAIKDLEENSTKYRQNANKFSKTLNINGVEVLKKRVLNYLNND